MLTHTTLYNFSINVDLMQKKVYIYKNDNFIERI